MPLTKDILLIHKGTHDVFLETGTHIGSSCLLAHECGFKVIKSCEPYEPLYLRAKERLKGIAEVHNQLSVDFLRAILPLHDKALLWLDAHSSGDGTFRGPDPLVEELSLVRSRWDFGKNLLVMVDDCRGRWGTVEKFAVDAGCKLCWAGDMFDPKDIAVLTRG